MKMMIYMCLIEPVRVPDDQDLILDDDSPDDRIDFKGVVQRIRAACDIPEVLVTRKSNMVGYEKVRKPTLAPRASVLLPWSESLLDKRTRASGALEEGRLDSDRGSRLFKPPNPKQMRFYRPEGASVAPADLSPTLAEYLNEELDIVRKISTFFNPVETLNMEKMVVNATAVLSWTELALRALAPIQSSLQGEQATQLDHHLTCLSRAVGFVMENLVAMGANWELKKRDAILEKLRNKELRATRRNLRNSPLFQDSLFKEELV